MRTRRVTGPATAVLAAVALAMSGCESGDDGTGTGSSAAPATSASTDTSPGAADPTAAAALGQATAALGNTSYKVTVTSGPSFRLTGTVDAPGSKGEAQLKATGSNTELTISTRLVGQDLYVQVPSVTKPGTWTRIDTARLPDDAQLGLRPGQIDPANAAKLLASTTDVRQTDPRSFQGTLDLTTAVGLTGIDKVTIGQYGDLAQKVPFTAGLDDQGRISVLTIQLPTVDGKTAAPLEVLYTDYGVTVGDLKPPASEIIEAPNELYTTLGGK